MNLGELNQYKIHAARYNQEAHPLDVFLSETPKARIGSSQNTVTVTRTGALFFAGFDRNDDYEIDKGEVSAGIDRAFLKADTDGTGVLSLVELEEWRQKALGSIDAAPTNFKFAPYRP